MLVLGVAYKPNIDDVRESPAVDVIERLVALGAKVDYNDPYVPQIPKMREHSLDMASVSLSPEMLRAYDCVMVVTNHSSKPSTAHGP